MVDEAAAFLPAGATERVHTDLGLSYAAIALILAAIAPGALLAQVAVARSDGTDRKHLVVGGAATLALALAVCGVATSGWVLALGALLLGAGSTCLVDGGEVVLAANGPLERTLGRTNLLGVVGGLAGPALLAGAIVLGVGWRAAFGAAAVAVAALAIALGRAEFPPARPVGDAEDGGDLAAPAADLRLGAAIAVGLVGLWLNPLDEAVLALVVAHAERDRGASAAHATLLGLAFIVGEALAYTVLPRLVAHRSTVALVTLGGVAMGGALAVTLVAPVVAVVAAGVAYSAGMGVAWLAVQRAGLQASPGREGSASAVIELVGVPGLLLPVAVGVVADRHGLGAAIAVNVLLALSMVAVAWTVRARLDRRGISR